MRFDAVGIEYAFANLVGDSFEDRGTKYEAFVFRDGDPKKLSEALNIAIECIYERTRTLNFTDSELEANGIGGQLNDALKRLHQIMLDMKRLKTHEPRDYHWNIIGAFLYVINTLLNVAEANIKK